MWRFGTRVTALAILAGSAAAFLLRGRGWRRGGPYRRSGLGVPPPAPGDGGARDGGSGQGSTYQAALQAAAHELGSATDIGEAVRVIAEHAVAATDALGAYVERSEDPDAEGEVEVIAAVGSGHPPLGTRIPYPGSLTEQIIESGEPHLMSEVGAIGERMAPYLQESCGQCSGLVVPLTVAEKVLGALVLLRGPGTEHFTDEEARQVRALGDLATAAFQRLLLIERLRESEERFRQIVDHLEQVVWLGAPDISARYYVNPAYERVFGRTLASFYEHPRSPVEAVHPEDRERVESALLELRQGGEYDIQYRIIRPDGEVRWIWSRGYPIRNARGEVYRVAGVMEDVTERIEGDEELRIRIQQLDALAALGQHALAETDLDELFARAVEVVARGVGADNTELLELLPGGTDLLLRAGTGWREGLVGSATTSADQESMAGYTLLSAEPVIVEDLEKETRFRGSWFLREHGAVSGLSVVVQGRERPWGALGAHTRTRRRFSGDDIFFLQSVSNILGQAIELRRIESERMRLLDAERESRTESESRRLELERVTESRARLMRGFSHDVKNPLGAADGFLQLMEQGVLDNLTPKQSEGVARARRAIGDALHLIGDLLSIARAEAGTIEIERVPMDLLATLRSAAEYAQVRAATKGLTLEVLLPGELPTIESDPDRIRQVLGNLLSNAVKYTERGGITITAELREGEAERGRGEAPAPGRWIAIAVTDTGPGIPEEQQRLIFREFGRLEVEGGEEGQGIGLFIARRIAQALGGEITVQSEVGRGSTFTLWLPLE